MPWETLTKFIERGIAAGISRDRLAEALGEAGWEPAQVRQALDAYAEAALPVAVPRPAIAATARELFLYLMVFSSLYMAVFGLGTILYQLINLAIPDPADRFYFSLLSDTEGRLRSGIATVAVFLPAYLLLDRRIAALGRADPGQRGSSVRRKLTYLTLYLTAIVLLSDASYFVSSWLGGELGKRVVLKCLVVAGLGVLVLGRYLEEMTADERLAAGLAPMVRQATLAIMVLASLGAVVTAYRNVDSPGSERRQQADRTREAALDQIDSAIVRYFHAYRKLPDSLDQLGRIQHVRFPRDPETGRAYRYQQRGANKYELCSSFHTTRTAEDLMNESPYQVTETSSTFAEHPAGSYCFAKEVAIPASFDRSIPAAAHAVPVGE